MSSPSGRSWLALGAASAATLGFFIFLNLQEDKKLFSLRLDILMLVLAPLIGALIAKIMIPSARQYSAFPPGVASYFVLLVLFRLAEALLRIPSLGGATVAGAVFVVSYAAAGMRNRLVTTASALLLLILLWGLYVAST